MIKSGCYEIITFDGVKWGLTDEWVKLKTDYPGYLLQYINYPGYLLQYINYPGHGHNVLIYHSECFFDGDGWGVIYVGLEHIHVIQKKPRRKIHEILSKLRKTSE
jgi:hypothetical protein